MATHKVLTPDVGDTTHAAVVLPSKPASVSMELDTPETPAEKVAVNTHVEFLVVIPSTELDKITATSLQESPE